MSAGVAPWLGQDSARSDAQTKPWLPVPVPQLTWLALSARSLTAGRSAFATYALPAVSPAVVWLPDTFVRSAGSSRLSLHSHLHCHSLDIRSLVVGIVVWLSSPPSPRRPPW